MWMLNIFKDLSECIESMSISSCNSIKIFDFSTLYTTISHSKLKHRMEELVQLCFLKKNGQRRYKYLVLGGDNSYFVKTTLILSKSFLKHIYYAWWTVDIPIGTYCASLLTDLFLPFVLGRLYSMAEGRGGGVVLLDL